jgi:hypothetical protein
MFDMLWMQPNPQSSIARAGCTMLQRCCNWTRVPDLVRCITDPQTKKRFWMTYLCRFRHILHTRPTIQYWVEVAVALNREFTGTHFRIRASPGSRHDICFEECLIWEIPRCSSSVVVSLANYILVASFRSWANEWSTGFWLLQPPKKGTNVFHIIWCHNHSLVQPLG